MYGKNASSHWRLIDDTIYHRGVTRDETLYGPDPHDFNPDRFTQADLKPPNPELFAFGFGRRWALSTTNSMFSTESHHRATIEFVLGDIWLWIRSIWLSHISSPPSLSQKRLTRRETKWLLPPTSQSTSLGMSPSQTRMALPIILTLPGEFSHPKAFKCRFIPRKSCKL